MMFSLHRFLFVVFYIDTENVNINFSLVEIEQKKFEYLKHHYKAVNSVLISIM